MAGKNRRGLQDIHKALLVRELACFATPKEAAAALNEAFGVEITPQGAERYDPNKKAGSRLADRWRTVFKATRKKFLSDMSTAIPEAHKAVRVRYLAHAARALKDNRNYQGMADMLERISKELGNVYTNKREYTGKDGGPIETKDLTSMMTPAQIDEQIYALLGRQKNPASVHKAPDDVQ